MKLKDLTVEVRNRSLERVGTITSKWLDMSARVVHNGVGEWELTLPATHPMATVLAQPGSGLVVSLYGAEKFSGPTTNPVRSTDRQNPDGTYTFRGVTDDILLADALAFPEPTNSDATTQLVANDVRSGNAETLMREFVAYNIANNATAGRRTGFRTYLQVHPTNQNRGITLTKSPRFQNLGELLGEIAVLSNLGFQVIQRGSVLQFEVLDIVDRSSSVRLDIKNGTMTKETLAVSPPKLTRAIVAGQGEGVDRTFVYRTTADSVTAENLWGRPIEQFIDQRNAADPIELQQAGDKNLLESGYTATAVKAIPADDQTMKYGVDWEVGDTVGLVTFGQETKATATAAVIIANSETVAVGASIGDISGFDATFAEAKRVEDTARRVDALERASGAGGGGPAGLITQEVKNDNGTAVTIGQPVYISGANGTNVLVKLAGASSEATSSKTLGLLAQDLAVNGIGTVVTEGFLGKLNTSAAVAGNAVWLSPVTGELVYGANKPTVPNHLVYIGVVLRAHATNGEIYVKVQNGFENDELHDYLVFEGDTPPTNPKNHYFWFNTARATLAYRYNDGDSTQWVEIKNPSDYAGASALTALTARVSAVEPKVTTLEATQTNVKSGYYVRQIETQIDTTGRSATGWVLGPTFAQLSFAGNSKIKMTYHIPMRNDNGGWGGIYLEPQVSFNGGTWQSLGGTGFESMTNSNADIFSISNEILLEPGIGSAFTAQFRFYFSPYDGTVHWNRGSSGNDRNINATSGTASLMAGNGGLQHYMHIIVEEYAKA